MIPDFYVFNTPKASDLITNIEVMGFNAYVSGKSDDTWLSERFTNPKRYILFWDEDRYGHVGDYPFEEPILCISLLEDYDDWANVVTWVHCEIIRLFPSGNITPEMLNFQLPSTQRREYNPPGEEVIIDGLKSHVLSTPPDEIDLKKGYSFNSFYDELYDVKYFEVYSPSSPTPFTVVVYAYSRKDDSWLFSDIYASNAWGRNRMESRYDYDFLRVLWKHLCLPGEFTMDVVKRRVDACYPDRVKNLDSLETEPSVYRRPMAEVMNMKRKRIQGEDYIRINPPQP